MNPDRRWIDVGWLTGYLLMTAAANRPSMVLVAEPVPPTDMQPFVADLEIELGYVSAAGRSPGR